MLTAMSKCVIIKRTFVLQKSTSYSYKRITKTKRTPTIVPDQEVDGEHRGELYDYNPGMGTTTTKHHTHT